MFNYGWDESPNDDDEQFYSVTIYNEEYYLEQEQEMIRQSNLEIELEKFEVKVSVGCVMKDCSSQP